ncbi:MAG TPA: hypothetical protein VMZ71_16325, partial [Gemmataceae bacterium]|nr:hypothetical protein [Gemmataceae bacterium]
RTWRLAVVAACGVAQAYVSVYLGYFLALLLAAGFAVAVVRFRRQLPWGELLRPGVRVWAKRFAVVAVALAAFLVLAARHAGSVGKIPLEDIRDMAPVPASWVTPPPGVAYLSGDLGWTPLPTELNRRNEHQLASGVLPVAATLLAALLIVRPMRVDSRLAVIAVGAVAACLLVVLVTRFGGVWLYEPLATARGSGGIRAMGRVVLVLLFPMGLALGAGLEMLAHRARRLAPVVAVVLLGVVMVEQRLVGARGEHAAAWLPYRTPVAFVLDRQARITNAIKRHPSPRLVFAFPSAGDGPGGWMAIQVEVMRAAQDFGVPSVNGWSGYFAYKWEHFPDYRGLMTWLTETNAVPPEQLRGLVLIGDPRPDPDPDYDAKMRAAFPVAPHR